MKISFRKTMRGNGLLLVTVRNFGKKFIEGAKSKME